MPAFFATFHMSWRESDFNILQKNTGRVNCFFITVLCFFIILDLLAARDRRKDSAALKRRLNLREILVIFSRFLHTLS